MSQHDLIVIGAGPGGYVAAIRAAQLGMSVGIVEREPALGGTCLRIGCIPSKALLESSEHFAIAAKGLKEHGVLCKGIKLDLPAMMNRKAKVVDGLTKGIDALMKKNKITRYAGHGRITGAGKLAVEPLEGQGNGKGDSQRQDLTAKHILIATGSNSATLPGVEFDANGRVGTSTEALSYAEVPKHLVVIGAGYIGLELGSVWLRLGAKVTVLEYLDRILPGTDLEIAKEAQKLFKRQGVDFQLSSRVTSARVAGKGKCVVEREGADSIECDRVLVAVGRVPNTENLGLQTVGVELGERGFVPVDEHFQTSANGVYAIGDVIGGPMLAHKAEDEGVACVERIATGYGHVNYGAIPGVCYTEPEIAGVGKSEEQLKEDGTPYSKGVFQFRGNGRARALAQIDGKAKVLAHKETDRILGVHIIGPRAGDLIAEAVAAIEYGASSEDLARTCHAHPTLPEVLKEAALDVNGRALHS